MKVLAAHRAGLTTVILPKRNARDLDDVPEEIRNAMQFILVDRIDEAIDMGLTRSENSTKGDYRPIDRNLNPLNEEISALDSPVG
jgi:ATP-dependent Lon protease